MSGGQTSVSTDAAAPRSERRSRAGRNLPVAIGVGLLLGSLVIGTLFWHRQLFLVLATVSVSIGVWEIIGALRDGADVRVPRLPAVLGCAAIMVAAFFGGTEALMVVFALTCALSLMWRGSDGVGGAGRDVSAGLLLAAYPPLLAGFCMLMLAPEDGAWRTFTFLAVTVASDVGGYAVGVLAGRHPMAPDISPKKSWEGFAGSVAFCMVIGAVCLRYALGAPWWVGLILGVVVAATATAGDLVESMLKRDLGIKDMGTILPGHGGLMDRLDSLVFTAAPVWVVLTVFVALPT
jgi:phosphatidate cytidylyltransferase